MLTFFLCAFEVVTSDFSHRISFSINSLFWVLLGCLFQGNSSSITHCLTCFTFREDCISIPMYSYSKVSVVSLSFCEILSSLGWVSLQILLLFKTADTACQIYAGCVKHTMFSNSRFSGIASCQSCNVINVWFSKNKPFLKAKCKKQSNKTLGSSIIGLPRYR